MKESPNNSILLPSKQLLNRLPPESLSDWRAVELDLGILSIQKTKDNARFAGVFMFPREIGVNPHLEKAQKASVQWAKEFGLVNSNEDCKKLDDAKFAAIVNTPINDQSFEELKMVADFTTCFFILDDSLEKSMEHNLADNDELHKLAAIFVNILKGKYKTNNDVPKIDFPSYSNFCNALFDIRKRLEIFCNSRKADLSFFLEGLSKYLVGSLWEVLQQSLHYIPSENTTLLCRRNTIGFLIILEISLFLRDITISTKLRKNPVLQRIIEASLHMIIITNDMVSLYKDIDNETANVFSLKFNELRQNKNIISPLQEAFNYWHEYYHKELLDVITLKDQLPNTEEAKQFYSIITSSMVDNANWHFKESKRYSMTSLSYKDINLAKLLE